MPSRTIDRRMRPKGPGIPNRQQFRQSTMDGWLGGDSLLEQNNFSYCVRCVMVLPVSQLILYYLISHEECHQHFFELLVTISNVLKCTDLLYSVFTKVGYLWLSGPMAGL